MKVYQDKFEETNGVIRDVNPRKTDHTKVKRTKNKQWSKTLHRKLRIEQHESHLKPVVNSGDPEG